MRARRARSAARIAMAAGTPVSALFVQPRGDGTTRSTASDGPKYGLAVPSPHPYAPERSGPNPTPEHRMKPDPPTPMQREATIDMAALAVNELGPMLTATEVADMLHLHVNTVKRLGDRGELPFYRVCKRGDRRFRLDDVMKFLSQNR